VRSYILALAFEKVVVERDQCKSLIESDRRRVVMHARNYYADILI